jgi:hypothetical protein
MDFLRFCGRSSEFGSFDLEGGDSETVGMEAWRTLAPSLVPKGIPPPRSCFFDGNIQAIGDRSGSDAVFRNYVHMYFSLSQRRLAFKVKRQTCTSGVGA